MTINGFGTFDQAQIQSAIGQRYIAEKLGSLVLTCPAASDIGLSATDKRTAVVAHIRITTTRHSSEWATDFIKRGRPYIFEISLDGTDSATDVANKLESAFSEYILKYHVAELPFTVSNSGSGELTLKLRSGELNFMELVTFLRKDDTYGLPATTSKFITSVQNDGTTPNLLGAVEAAGQTTLTLDDNRKLSVGDVILIGTDTVPGVEGTAVEHKITGISNANTTDVVVDPAVPVGGYVEDAIITVKSDGEEPVNSGKYLEENVRMSLAYTSDSYCISPGESPAIEGGYTMVKWVSRASEGTGISPGWEPHKHLSTVAADAKVGDRDMEFTLYFKEDSAMTSVTTLVDFLIGGTPTISTFLKANGGVSADTANFVA